MLQIATVRPVKSSLSPSRFSNWHVQFIDNIYKTPMKYLNLSYWQDFFFFFFKVMYQLWKLVSLPSPHTLSWMRQIQGENRREGNHFCKIFLHSFPFGMFCVWYIMIYLSDRSRLFWGMKLLLFPYTQFCYFWSKCQLLYDNPRFQFFFLFLKLAEFEIGLMYYLHLRCALERETTGIFESVVFVFFFLLSVSLF